MDLMSKLDFDHSRVPPANIRGGTGHCMVGSLFREHCNFGLYVLHNAHAARRWEEKASFSQRREMGAVSNASIILV
jgi:hypothetical protein